MATPQTSKAFIYEKDPLLDVTQKPTPVDNSSQFRGSNIINAQTGGSNSAGLNNATPSKTVFSITNGTNYKIRWDTCALALKCKFADVIAYTNNITAAAPSWNALQYQIESIALRFNNQGVDIYNSTNGTYYIDYMMRLFRNYDADVLNNGLDNQIFGPIWAEGAGEEYRFKTADGPPVTYTNELSSPSSQSNVYAYDAAATPARLTPLQNERNIRNGVLAGKTDTRTKFIPFVDLFPRFIGIPNNLRSVQIEIQWSGSRYNTAFEIVHGGTGALAIIDAYVVTDYYSLASPAQVETISEKSQGAVDNMTYLNPIVLTTSYAKDTDILLSSQKNLEAVAICQPNIGLVNSVSDVTYKGCGHLNMFDISKACATTVYATHQGDGRTGYASPLASVQCQYGSIMFPPYTLTTVNGIYSDLGGLYNEYLKVLNCVGSHHIKPLPFNIYNRILPFIMLKPWTSHAQHLTQEGQDLIIKLRMASTSSISTTQIQVVVFRLQVCQISPDGTVSVNY